MSWVVSIVNLINETFLVGYMQSFGGDRSQSIIDFDQQ